mmetsp:Transcript_57335/g.136288  ORF Transcript_57335/g.136288 Transcript_57335/m.136288 type:complete len:350 (+) Transcript_57335:77-1126(+)|eukprot:CAMPEP_0178412542 /NCGR_PEP_ID=MMETSP0689_2-20121128/22068_1 /TAXON_ID=160604 /ORGANISM="Amphidinium massartii, Strain CS-259" /LENGTH=349 /DNA_ID=CAMNT_0020033791 /DNA_START=77 /DNA_END=1126 /DNA_ORIENTATION=-
MVLTPAQRSEAAKRGAQTLKEKRAAKKKGENIVEAGADIVDSNLSKTGKWVGLELSKPENERLAFHVKSMLEDGSLANLLLPKENPESTEAPRVQLRKEIKHPHQLTDTACWSFVQAFAPHVVDELSSWECTLDLKQLIFWALHIAPEAWLPTYYDEQMRWLDVLTEWAVHRYKCHGSKLDNGLPKDVKYWVPVPEAGAVCLVLPGLSLQRVLPGCEQGLPEDFVIDNPTRAAAVFHSKKKYMSVPLREFFAEADEDGVLEQYEWFWHDEKGKWEEPPKELKKSKGSKDEMDDGQMDCDMAEADPDSQESVKRQKPSTCSSIKRAQSFSDDVFSSLSGSGRAKSSRVKH